MAKMQAQKDMADAAEALYGNDEGGEAALVPSQGVSLAKVGEVSGEISKNDFVLPLLQITQGTGPLSRLFRSGDVVLAKEVRVVGDNEPFDFVVLSLTKYFQERLAYDPNGPRPMTFATEAEVKAAGLTLDWVNNGPGQRDTPPTAEPVAIVVLLVKRPEGHDSPIFSVNILGEDFAVAQWIVQRTAYTRVAKRLFTARATELAAGGLVSGRWSAVVRDATVGGNVIKSPTLSLVSRNSDEFVEAVKQQFN